jgi:hypothetical protein
LYDPLCEQFNQHRHHLSAIVVLELQNQSARDALVRNSNHRQIAIGLHHCKKLCPAFDAQYASDVATRLTPLSEQHSHLRSISLCAWQIIFLHRSKIAQSSD